MIIGIVQSVFIIAIIWIVIGKFTTNRRDHWVFREDSKLLHKKIDRIRQEKVAANTASLSDLWCIVRSFCPHEKVNIDMSKLHYVQSKGFYLGTCKLCGAGVYVETAEEYLIKAEGIFIEGIPALKERIERLQKKNGKGEKEGEK